VCLDGKAKQIWVVLANPTYRLYRDVDRRSFGKSLSPGINPFKFRQCDHVELELAPAQPCVRVSRKGADRVRSGHPWIFRSDVTDTAAAQPGDTVRVLENRGQFLGQAHYSAASLIALRMLSRAPDLVDIGARIADAQRFREQVVTDSTAYRLVHGEADFLPGLIIDRYADYFAVQTLDQGMDRAMPEIAAALEAQFHPRAIVGRNDASVRSLEHLPREVTLLAGDLDSPVPIHMNGFRMEADLLHGQKTGVFLDQRENYLAAARYARGRALDCFTSTGGFALHLARTCELVEAVDSSAPALAAAQRNADANGISNVTFHEADGFELLSSYASARRNFDVIVLDPPAFAKSRKQIDGAIRGYKDINLRALRLLSPGGILVTCSCSHHVSEAMFLGIVAEASLDAGRTLRVLERRTQAQDHPILLTVPETLYLKCLVLQVA
jgi:23S rRNA (cytosine1962-C5)-methyltransferase